MDDLQYHAICHDINQFTWLFWKNLQSSDANNEDTSVDENVVISNMAFSLKKTLKI